MSADPENLLAQWLRATAAEQDLSTVDRLGPLPASLAQRGIWMTQQLLGRGSSALVMHHELHLRGDLDPEALRLALGDLVARHETLRTCFRAEGSALLQVISEPQAVAAFHRVPGDALSLDLARGPMLRSQLTQPAPGEWVLLLLIHHIANDGWSMQVLHRDLAGLYAARLGIPTPPLPTLRFQYADLAAWHSARIESGAHDRDLDFWRDRLGRAVMPALPTESRALTGPGRRVERFLPADITAGVSALATSRRSTPFLVLLAALQAALSQWSGRPSARVGLAVAGKHLPEADDLIGPFATVLPLHLDISPEWTFAELLDASSAEFLQACAHEVPLELILDRCLDARRRAAGPLFQVGVSSQLDLAPGLALPGVEVTPVPLRDLEVIQPLSISFWAHDDGIQVAADHATSAFSAAAIDTLLDHFVRLLRG